MSFYEGYESRFSTDSSLATIQEALVSFDFCFLTVLLHE